MAEQAQSFTKMAGAKASGEAPVVGVGMLGYAFMGKAHSNGYKKLPYMMYPPVAIPRLVAIAGRNEEATAEAARRYGYERYYTDWHKLIEDQEIQLFDNGGPGNMHAEPTIAAAQAGKHVFCEKPMSRNAKEGYEMWQAVAKTGVKNMIAFNYRFVPAIRLAHDLITSGKLGKIYHFRAVYLQEWIMPHYDTGQIWRLSKDVAGSGAIGDLGSHIIDLGRYPVRRGQEPAGHDQDVHPDTLSPRRHALAGGRRRCLCRHLRVSRTAPSAPSRRAASPRAARTTTAGRSTARRVPSASTSSA